MINSKDLEKYITPLRQKTLNSRIQCYLIGLYWIRFYWRLREATVREATGGNGRQWEAMGGNGRQREATGGNGRQREATKRPTTFGAGQADTDIEEIYSTLSDKLFRE